MFATLLPLLVNKAVYKGPGTLQVPILTGAIPTGAIPTGIIPTVPIPAETVSVRWEY